MTTFRFFSRPPFCLLPALQTCSVIEEGAGGTPADVLFRDLTRPRVNAEVSRDALTIETEANPPAGAYTMHSIVLADDHDVVRQSIKKLLKQQEDFHLVGEARNGLETLSLVRHLQPDLLVTDLMMPGLNGLEVTRRIRLSSPLTRVVVVSVNGDEPYVSGAFRCGASAYVLKTFCGKYLLPALRAVLAGQRYVSPPLSQDVI